METARPLNKQSRLRARREHYTCKRKLNTPNANMADHSVVARDES